MLVLSETCYVCGKMSGFSIDDGACLWREALCEHCGCSIRNSDVAKEIVKVLLRKDLHLEACLDELESFHILEAAADGPINRRLRDLPNYTCFEYFDGVKPGEQYNGITCNDLEALTYDSRGYDLVITQDVLEHVYSPARCFKELNRVLKIGGAHVFTIPLHSAQRTKSRKGKREIFHGDPIRKDGALVRTDWGYDITSYVDRFGMKTEQVNSHIFYPDKDITDVDVEYEEYLNKSPLFYYRYNSVVFVSRKISEVNRVKYFVSLLLS